MVSDQKPRGHSRAQAHVGVTIAWQGETGSVDEVGVDKADPSNVLVRIDPKYFRPTEVDLLVGDYARGRVRGSLPRRAPREAAARTRCAPQAKAKKELGWSPKITFKALAEEMVDADMKELLAETSSGAQ